MPLEGDATFDGRPAGWCVYPPGSAHRPTVAQGRALVLYLLPEGQNPSSPNDRTLFSNYVGRPLAGRQRRRHAAVRPGARHRAGARRRDRARPARAPSRFARETGGAALRALTYRQRAGLLAADRARCCRRIATPTTRSPPPTRGTVKNDSAVDIDGAIFTLGQYAKWGDALGDVRALRDGDAVKLGKEPVVPVAAPAGADARRGAVHQRLQLPVLGPVGKGRARAAVGRAGDRQARHRRPPG